MTHSQEMASLVALNVLLGDFWGYSTPAVQEAMETLAGQFKPKELEQAAYGLYEQFRPGIPAGRRGWGAKGELDLGLIRSLGDRI